MDLHARQILDSRGNPTIEIEMKGKNGISIGHAPAGASTGANEAIEKRDGGKSYFGKSVMENVKLVNGELNQKVKQFNGNWQEYEAWIISENKNNRLGGNTTTALSIAGSKHYASEKNQPFHQWMHEMYCPNEKYILPVPFFNIINGGKHAGNNLAIQEYMLVPTGAESFSQALEYGSEIYHTLKQILAKKYGPTSTNVGDEGGFALPEGDVFKPLELILMAAEQIGLKDKISLAIDAAATSFFADGKYMVSNKQLSTMELAEVYKKMTKDYPIISLEDPFEENDMVGFNHLTSQIGNKVQIVGDDILCTNEHLVQKALDAKACNALLLKVNQAGTVSQSLNASKLAHKNNWSVMVSHRSGETEDPFISELAVGINSRQIKSGAPARAERTAKYNQLLRIEERLAQSDNTPFEYAGRNFRKI